MLAPGIEPAGERADALNASPPQQQRHTGAGSFAGSSTVKDDLAVARDFLMALLEFFRAHVERAGEF